MFEIIESNGTVVADIEDFDNIPKCDIVKISLSASDKNDILARQNGFIFADRTILTSINVQKTDLNFDKLIRVPIEETSGYRDEISEIAKKSFPYDRRFHYCLNCDDKNFANFMIDKWISGLDKVLIGKYRDKAIGFLALKQTDDKTLFVHLAATDEKYRLTGIAMSLYAKAILTAKENGFKKLEGRISTKNTDVMNLYTFLGAHFESPIDIYLKDLR